MKRTFAYVWPFFLGPLFGVLRLLKIKIMAYLYHKKVFFHGIRTGKMVALTFDDGPDHHYTPLVLDILNKKNVLGTFFVVGEKIQRHPEVMKKIVSEGHIIGNHTWSHLNLKNQPRKVIRSEIKKTEEEIIKFTGYQTTLFRPPYGLFDRHLVKSITKNYLIVNWSADSLDWQEGSKEEVKYNILSRLRPGDIILLHCSADEGENLDGMLEALPEVIDTLEKEGFQFVSVPELLGQTEKKKYLVTTQRFFLGQMLVLSTIFGHQWVV